MSIKRAPESIVSIKIGVNRAVTMYHVLHVLYISLHINLDSKSNPPGRRKY